MRLLITGANGMLGRALTAILRGSHDIVAVDADTLDVSDASAVSAFLRNAQPDLVIHCAALTAVDYCAEHPDEALAVNGFGTQAVAQACLEQDAALVYISTNEVFDGLTDRVCLEYDSPNPLNPYAYSKWVGEQAVRDLVPRHMIVRTAWLFAHGGKNFIQTMLRLAGEGVPLSVVTNEVSNPTYANDLAAAIARLIEAGRYGIYHLVNEGHTSRYALARFVLDHAGYADTPINPIALAEFTRPSRPPQYAILRNVAAARLGITLRPWQEAVKAFLEAERAAAK